MVVYGADVGELRSLATLLRAKADLLDADVRVIGSRLRGSPWTGVDADGFRHLWSQQTSQRLRAVASGLRAAAETLDRNATEQDQASRAEGGTSAAASHKAATPSGDKMPRGGPLGYDRDRLDLADACGTNAAGKPDPTKIPADWSEVSSNEMKKLGIEPELLRSKNGDGFSATLYKSVNGEYVLAYAGTQENDLGDHLNHLKSYGAGMVPPQVLRAIETSTVIKAQLEAAGVSTGQISFTGHSLGGALAATSSIATGLKATTFNAAGLNELSIEKALASYDSGGGTSTPLEASRNVTSYTGTGDWLTQLQMGAQVLAPLSEPIRGVVQGVVQQLAPAGEMAQLIVQKLAPELAEELAALPDFRLEHILELRPAFGEQKSLSTPLVLGLGGHDPKYLGEAIDSLAEKEGPGYYAPTQGGAADTGASVRL